MIESRAALYWWFSTLFSRELDETSFNAHLNEQGQLLLTHLAQVPELEVEVNAVKQGLNLINQQAHPHLESAVEFTQLFLGDLKQSAPPYASVYLSEQALMFQKPHQDMVILLNAQGLTVNKSFNEPADHLAIQLDYLGNLILSAIKADDIALAEQEQAAFIQHHILNWLSLFIDKLKQCKQSGFYLHLAQLLKTYLELEVSLLAASYWE
ncbi:molecular chaperone TorD [Catenovulum sp. SM1970]|nr:molecular chaperone TorD [Marinifaba aquimaris]